MFLLVPALLILAAFLGIGVVVWRKMPYLKKLSTEHHDIDGSLFYLYFPEVVDGFNHIPWTEYKELWLSETEKLLRKLRLLSMKIDRMVDGLIKKVRNFSGDSEESKGQTIVAEEAREEKKEELPPISKDEEMKKEEQMLIVEIAKNPKDIALYKTLASLYERMGNLEDARESYKTASTLDPNDDIIRMKLAKVIERIEEEARAKAKDIEPGEGDLSK